ncbi:MAG: bifunctional 3,4-dihydroxy-2-butanone-4-phosphate synthase/GTP cyclohydrolase II [Chloroflexi bacterium]|nr:bifunctional 3,4-dihydroxy-2-butanone-4-phosphate synthase/GTP cyclohydrolase II [Chloroflexota bacterium]
MALATIEQALEELRAGRMIIVVDDEGRENEGDLVMAAEKVSPEAVNFMAAHGRGLICVALTGDRLDALRIPMMVPSDGNTSRFQTAFTVSVDARHGITTGISAPDRAITIRALVDPATRPEDLVMPGHVFPLRAREGGVLERAGHTEAAVDLARLAGLRPAGVICEILAEDGSMARMPDLEAFAAAHRLKIVRVADLIAYRRQHERWVRRVAQAHLPTRHGTFAILAYEEAATGACHLALVMGEVDDDRPVLVRVHSECLTGEVFGSQRCDCGPQLDLAMQRIGAEGRGVVLYLRQEGRGIGLCNKLHAYALQEQGMDTVEANEQLGFPPDLRDYSVGAQILLDLGVRELRLLTNNPRKVAGLAEYGLHVVERIPLVVQPTPENRFYLRTKREKLGHLLETF